jgi:RHS repeat-associated protein
VVPAEGRDGVKPIKMFAITALVTAAAISVLAAPAARAEQTALCKTTEYPCPSASRLTSIALGLSSGSVWSVKTVNPTFTVLCLKAELKGTVLEIGSPQKIDRTAQTYSNCGTTEAHNNCTVTSFFELTKFEVTKTAQNLGELKTSQGETVVKCTILGKTKLECTYRDKSLVFHVKGHDGSNGHGMVTGSELPWEVAGGAICPEKSLVTTKLEPTEDIYLGQNGPNKDQGYGTGNPGSPKVCKVCVGDPVDPASGNLTETQTDNALNGRGPNLNVTRSYNSQLAATQTTAGPFGYGWTGPYSASLEISSETETAIVHQDNGSATVFTLAGGTYSAGAWVEATLKKEGENYLYTLPSQEKLEFNKTGQLTKEADRHGNALTLTYKEGNLETVKDTAGRTLTFAYKEGKVEKVTDPMGHAVKYTYESGNLATVTLPGEESARWKFKYDGSHRLTEITDGISHTTKNEYDGSDRVTLQTDPLERKHKFEYGETGGVKETTITEPNGSKTLQKFNAGGEPTEITRAYGTGIARTTKYEYSSALRMTKRTDANNHVTTYGYDSEGNKTSEKDANENETKWAYNATHDVTSETTAKGEMTTTTRNAAGDPETIKRPAPGSKTQEIKFKYAANGDLEEKTDPLGHTTKYEYDTYGNRKAEIDPEGNKVSWGYNEDGQQTSEVSPRGNEEGAKASEFETKTEHDAQGRPKTITDPLGHETKYKYDANGNLEVLTNPNGHATTYVYNADDERTEVKAANGNTTKTTYDSMGRIESKTDGNNHTTNYERDLLGQITEEVDSLKRKTTLKWDAAGNLKELKDPEERTTTYTYDPGDRVKEVDFSEATTPDVSYEYGKDGEVTVMKDGTGTNKYAYDELDRLTEAENGNKEVVKYEYDLGNQGTKITYPNGKSITRAFDNAGRLEKVTDWLGKETKFAYNRNSALKATTFPSASENKDEYEYNQADELTKATMKRGAETLASISYARDNAGQTKSATQTGLPGAEKPEYEYDERERLKKGAGTSFEYDAASNPTKLGSTTLKYDNNNQLEEGGGVKYTFSGVGERTKATPEAGPATTYGYDQAGNLISVTRSEEKGKVEKIEDTYAYDGKGLRASEKVSGVKTQMTWDVTAGLPLLLYDGTNYYIYGPDGLPFEQITSEAASYLHHDHQGSTRLITNASGEAKGKYTYTPYGAVEEHTGTSSTPLGYGGQYRNESTGLVYLRARAYDPSTAQFTSVDPKVAETGESYVYAGDNPINLSDPSGEQVRTPRGPTPPRPPSPPAGGGAGMGGGVGGIIVPGGGWGLGGGWSTGGMIWGPGGGMITPGGGWGLGGGWSTGGMILGPGGGMITPGGGWGPWGGWSTGGMIWGIPCPFLFP